MSHVAKCCHDEEATSETASQVHQSSWMSHWTKKSLNPPPMVNSSMLCYENGNIDNNNSFTKGQLKIEDGFPNSIRLGEKVEEIATGIIDENLKKNEISYSPFPALKHFLDMETSTTATKALTHHEFGDKAIFLALSLGKDNIVKNFNELQKIQLRNSEKRVMSHSYPGQKGITDSKSSAYKELGSTSNVPPHQSDHGDAPGPVVVFERHFSNDNVTCFGQGHCKYQNLSTFLIHEKKMNDRLSLALSHRDGLQMRYDPSMNKNFLPFFLKKQSEYIQGHFSSGVFPTHEGNDQGNFFHGCRQTGHRVPCTVHNVETMRICTMVDSMENSPGGPPKISQTAHHLLFTKETCVNVSDAHQEVQEPTFSTPHENKTVGFPRPQGVKIQPMWNSTDSEEKEITLNPSTCKLELRNEASAETEVMQIESRENQHSMLGTESTSLIKHDADDENVCQVALDSRAERSQSKRPIVEIPDMNEELQGIQPAVSSTDGTEPSASRVHSLDAKQLFPFGEESSRSEALVMQDRPLGLDPTNRWIKRLKSSPDSFGVGTKSSEVEEASSNEKFKLFFNSIMKGNKASLENVLSKRHGKEDMKSLKDIGSSFSGLKRKRQDMVLSSSWIQRWCQNSSPSKNPEPVVICEPHSLKLGPDGLSKKQFPSIAAMALMGKARNGFPPCEFRKKGSIVVWKTEY